MYGLVNKAVQQLVVTRFGADQWDAIRLHAQLDVDEFACMRQYDDAITYRLVESASAVLGITPDQVLIALGEHWTQFSAGEGYGELLRMSGRNLVDLLENLDNLHTRLGLSFPDFRPPSFRCVTTPEGVEVHYVSERTGLTSFVVGLLQGLGTMFKTRLEVTVRERRDEGAAHDVFDVRFLD